MEKKETDQYSLWLKPEQELYYVLKKTITSLSIEYKAPLFEPHITVVGGIVRDINEIERIVRPIAASCDPMTLRLTETHSLDSFYRSLFIEVAPNDTLLSLREDCQTELKIEHKPYMPHVSLIYKKLEEAEKQTIIEQVGKRFDLIFNPVRLYLMKTSGEPASWKEEAVFPLSDDTNT